MLMNELRDAVGKHAGLATSGASKNKNRAVTMQHAAAPVMSCATCHQRDSPTLLHTLSGQTVAIDHAYQMCAQCHATQAAVWAGGAHGKRAGGWAPPRVRYNCTECHNPHRPKFESRWPAGPGRTQTP